MFLSIIIPIYNAEKYIDECISSLLNQDLEKEYYEIICVNDGSVDRSREILSKYESRNNVKVIDQENGGIGVARNTGLKAAQGEYIWFVDADDFIQENILGEIYQKITSTKCDRFQMNVYTFNDNLSDEEQELKKRKELKANVYYHAIVVWNSIFRREFLILNNIRFHYPDLAYSEDQVFMIEVLMNVPNTELCDLVVYFYRRNSSSVTANHTDAALEKAVESYIKVANIVKDYYINENGEKGYLADSLMANIWSALFIISKLSKKEADYKIKEMKKYKLYPFVKPKECTLTKSYQTTRTDFVGKVFDKLYTNLHTCLGYNLMRVFQLLRRIKHNK